jgi:hypothetical protein
MPNQPSLPPLGAVQNQPQNINFLAKHRFRLLLRRAPNVQYFVQEANLPGLSMGNASQPTPFTNLPVPGDKLNFEDLTITFPVDEDMTNYKEIANWLVGETFPKQYGQYKDLVKSYDGPRSDVALMILDSNSQVKHTVVFRDAFPVSISGLSFDTKATDTDLNYASATFKYSYWEFDEVDAATDTSTQADGFN